jgi:hypothetical protein
MPRAEITIKVVAREDLVPVRSFLTIVYSTLSILKDLERANRVEHSAVWKVSATSLQSPLSLTMASDALNGKELARECVVVFEQTEKSSETSQSRWTQGILESAKKFVSVLSNGVAKISLSTADDQTVSPTQRVAASVDYLLAPAYEDFGTFEGRLETLSVHGRTRFNIYEALTERPIACYFSQEKLDDALKAFNKRISVSGKAKYNRLKHPISVVVEGMRYLEGGVHSDEFRDINITEGVDSAKFIRGLRDAE